METTENCSHTEAQDRCEALADALTNDVRSLHGYTPNRLWLDSKRLCLYDRKGEPLATFHVEQTS